MVTVTALPAVAVRVVGTNLKSWVARLRVAAPPAFDAALDAVVADDLLPPPPPQPARTSPAVAATSPAVIHLRPRMIASVSPALRGSCPKRMMQSPDPEAGLPHRVLVDDLHTLHV